MSPCSLHHPPQVVSLCRIASSSYPLLDSGGTLFANLRIALLQFFSIRGIRSLEVCIIRRILRGEVGCQSLRQNMLVLQAGLTEERLVRFIEYRGGWALY